MSSHEEQFNLTDKEWVRKLVKDTYIGNGKPGIIARIAAVEKTTEAITFYARWLLVTTAGLIVVGILNLILKH